MLGFAGLLAAGCTTTLDGQVKATAIPFRKNVIISRYERPVQAIVDVAKEVITKNGRLTGDDAVTKVISGQIDTRTVLIKVEEVQPTVTQVSIQVLTKMRNPDMDLAREIDKEIVLRLR